MRTLAVTAFEQTLIGAAAAIAGGLLAGLVPRWGESRQAAEIARQIRRQEHEDDALYELDSVLTPIETRIALAIKHGTAPALAFSSVSAGMAAFGPTEWAKILELMDKIVVRWAEGLSKRTHDAHVRERYAAMEGAYDVVRDQLHGRRGKDDFPARVEDWLRSVTNLRLRLDQLLMGESRAGI